MPVLRELGTLRAMVAAAFSYATETIREAVENGCGEHIVRKPEQRFVL